MCLLFAWTGERERERESKRERERKRERESERERERESKRKKTDLYGMEVAQWSDKVIDFSKPFQFHAESEISAQGVSGGNSAHTKSRFTARRLRVGRHCSAMGGKPMRWGS